MIEVKYGCTWGGGRGVDGGVGALIQCLVIMG